MRSNATATLRHTLTLPALLVAAGATAAAAQQTFPPNPAVDRIFAEWDEPTSPGCALGVIQDGRFIYQKGYGMANLDYDIPNSPHDVYYVGSDSKQFTAALVAMLALDGRIDLNDDIRKYFPELPDYGAPIRIRNLIHHTSGIRDMYVLMRLAGLRLEDVFPNDEYMSMLVRQKELNFAPGTEYNYSNSGYWLLSQLVERVTGKPFREVADERIFKPLGMTHTHFHDDPGHVMKWRAMSYEPDGKGGFRISFLQNFDKVGAGGLYTSIDDLLKWDDNFYSHQVGGDALQQLIRTRGILGDGDTLNYAFGNEITSYRGLRTTEHGGSMMGYKAYILRFPDERFSVLETCNLGSIDPGPLAHRVADVYLAGKLGPEVAAKRTARKAAPASDWSPSPEELTAFAGDYYSDELDVTYHVRSDAGKLLVSWRNTPETTFSPAGRDAFSGSGLTLHFTRDDSGRTTGFAVDAGRVQHIHFTRKS